MIFDNDLEKCNDFITPSGNQYENLYSVKVLKDGTCVLEVSGQKDLKQEINSWREHTDMSYILRAMDAGTYVGRENIMYGDFTRAPESLADALQIIMNAERSFYELPLDTRNKFDNDWRKWMVAANSDLEKFNELMGFEKPDAPVV